MPRHLMSEGNECRIVLLDDANVGKTALLSQLTEGYFPCRHTPTLLDCVVHAETVDGFRYRLDITDCCADEDFAMHRAPYIESADVIILVYSVLDKASLLGLERCIAEVERVREATTLTRPTLLDGELLGSRATPPPSFCSSAKATPRCCPLLPYHREVPIFVVGTHADRLDGPGSAADVALAERIAGGCMRRAGLRPFGCTATAPPAELRPSRANSTTSFKAGGGGHKLRSLWDNIFKPHDASGKARNGESSHHNFPSPPPANAVPATLSTSVTATTCGTVSSATAAAAAAAAVAAVPPGASPTLPHYRLSAKRPQEVWTLFQAVVRLHVYMRDPLRQSALAASGFTTPLPESLHPSSAGGSRGSRPPCGSGSGTPTSRGASTVSAHARTLSGGVRPAVFPPLLSAAERFESTRLPEAGNLYYLNSPHGTGPHPRSLSSSVSRDASSPTCPRRQQTQPPPWPAVSTKEGEEAAAAGNQARASSDTDSEAASQGISPHCSPAASSATAATSPCVQSSTCVLGQVAAGSGTGSSSTGVEHPNTPFGEDESFIPEPASGAASPPPSCPATLIHRTGATAGPAPQTPSATHSPRASSCASTSGAASTRKGAAAPERLSVRRREPGYDSAEVSVMAVTAAAKSPRPATKTGKPNAPVPAGVCAGEKAFPVEKPERAKDAMCGDCASM